MRYTVSFQGISMLALLGIGLGLAAILLPVMPGSLRIAFALGACAAGGGVGTWAAFFTRQHHYQLATQHKVIEAMAERSHDGIIIVHNEIVVYANSHLAQMLGYCVDEIIGRSFVVLIAPGQRDAVRVRHRRRVRGLPEPQVYESILVHNQGSAIPVELRVGEIDYNYRTCTLALIRDLTDRKRTEAALQASEARSAAILEALPDLMYRISRDGVYLDVQASGPYKEPLRTLDVQPALLIGKRLADAIPESVARQILEVIRAALDSGMPQITEYELVTRSGKRMFEARIVVSGPDEVVSIVRDVTERKRVEQERERLISDLDAFAQTVAHDLKTPLTSVMGYAEMLSDDFDTLDNDSRNNFLWIISHESQKMARIIHELLMFASVREQRDVPRRAVNMNYIVTNALGRMSYLITERDAQVTTPGDEWPIARGYAPWVEEVWVNYLSNALKYGGKPPVIMLGADEQAGGMLRFWVRDNGPGVSFDDQRRIFEQFTRLSTVKVSGYGLGLSIVKRIIEKLGGTVGVDSTPGEGSTFYFTLPRL